MSEIEIHAMRAYLHHLYGYICEMAKVTPICALPEAPEDFIRKYLEAGSLPDADTPLGEP